MLRTRLPSMYSEDNTHTFVGIVVNGIVVCALWIMLRHVIHKYNKEC